MARLSDARYRWLTNASMVVAIVSAVLFDRGSAPALAVAMGAIAAVVAACTYFCAEETATPDGAAMEQRPSTAAHAAVAEPAPKHSALLSPRMLPRDGSLPIIQSQPTIVFGGRRNLKNVWELEALCQPDQPSTQFARDVLDVVEWFGRGDIRVVLTHHGTVASIRSTKPSAGQRPWRRLAEWDEFVKIGTR
jgi:hypothetical protein